MAKYVNNRKVKEPVTKNIIVNVYSEEGVLTKVTTGGFLGTIPMVVEGKTAKGTGVFRGKEYPVDVAVGSLGTVPPQKEYQGNTFVEQDKIVNALDYVDLDRQEKLTEAEKVTLSAIGTKALHKIVVDALEASPRVWTPFIDACQQVDQDLRLPLMVEVPNYVEIEGHKAIGCAVTVDVNGARFLFGECEVRNCTDGSILHQFVAPAAVGIFPDGNLYYPAD